MVIEINIIYGLILVILSLILSGDLLFSKKESRDNFVYDIISESSINISRNTSSKSENVSSNLGRFSRFKLTIKRRHFLKALFPLFCPCYK